jgi:hypothetical protein
MTIQSLGRNKCLTRNNTKTPTTPMESKVKSPEIDPAKKEIRAETKIITKT